MLGGSGSFTLNLPAASTMTGRILYLKKTNNTGLWTIDPNGSETIEGVTTYLLTSQGTFITIACDGTAWYIFEDGIKSVTTKTGDYTVTIADDFIISNNTLANATFTLPAANTMTGRILYFKKISSNTFSTTIDANASETIDGALTKVLIAQYSSVNIYSDGTSWYVVSETNISNIVNKTNTYIATIDDDIVIAGGTANYTVTLPQASTATGHELTVKKTSAAAYTVTIDGYGSENVDGYGYLELISQYSSASMFCDGYGWYTK